MSQIKFVIEKSPRIQKLVDHLYANMPEIEADRAELITESYKETEGLPIVKRRSAAFRHIMENIPIVIRPDELIVGSNSIAPRGCQTFPEYSFEWLEKEYDTVATREADPFYISPTTVERLKKVYPYWKGKTVSDLAAQSMDPEVLDVFLNHGVFTVGNYFYNGIGHINVDYAKVINKGLEGVIEETKAALAKLYIGNGDYLRRKNFLESVIESCEAVITYAKRYSELARQEAQSCNDSTRRAELIKISENCARVPAKPARNFYEACQAFWFIQQLPQCESSGHSISPGRFDQYMYPLFKQDIDAGRLTYEQAQEYIDCIWVKLNDLNKVRDADSAEGFAGYSLFQNLIVGGQDKYGLDATNDLSFMCVTATEHVFLPQPSFSVRVWNGTPHEFLIRAAELTRTGIGFPAYYNDEVIIPSLQSRGLTIEDARDYNIIGCVEPQKAAKTDGWHDAAFFNMLRPLEMVFSSGMDKGVQLGPKTKDVASMTSFEELKDAYQQQMNYFIELMVNADNAIDLAHGERCPLPFQSSMVSDCIGRGKSMQEGGAIYNFTGPQGFGIANVTDGLYAIKKLVFDDKKYTLAFVKEALENNYGKEMDSQMAAKLTKKVLTEVAESGREITAEDVKAVYNTVRENKATDEQKKAYGALYDDITEQIKFGNDIDEIDVFAREMAYTYTKPLENYYNPRGGRFQAGLYPVSANVPLGAQTGATPDARLAYTPIADGVSPAAGRDINGPTAAANSVSRLDHYIASNGTLFNMKFHPSALEGRSGLESFVALVRGYFDRKGSHMQFNVVSRETLRDAQKNPDKYRSLVVRVAGYSALFTTLSKGLQEDIINRTEQAGF